MASIVSYENVFVVSPTPTSDGGLALNNNFIAIADELASHTTSISLLAPIASPQFTGTLSADSGAITSDGSGNLTAVSFIGNLHFINSDGGVINSDGSGNITATSFNGNLIGNINGSLTQIISDGSTITSDGSGNLTAASFIGGGSGLTGVIDSTAFHSGSLMNFDGGLITSDGNGNLIASTLTTSNGPITAGSVYSDGGAFQSDGHGNLQVNGITFTYLNGGAFSSALLDGNITSDGLGNLVVSSITTPSIVDPGAGFAFSSTRGFYVDSGNISSDGAGLLMALSFWCSPLGVAPATPNSGQIYFDGTNNHFYGYNGSVWKQLDN